MIQRDGYTNSLWQEHAMPYQPNHAELDQYTVYDVAIVGGGITGITLALLLQLSGKRCVLLEAETLAFGTTGGTTAHLNTLLDTTYDVIASNFSDEAAADVATAARDAIALIKKHIADYNIDCGFEDTEAYLFTQNEEETKTLEKIYDASLSKAKLSIQYIDHIPVPIPFEKAVCIQEHAKFNPLPYVYALARAYEQAGGSILQNCRVTAHNDSEVIEVTTSLGTLKTNHLVYATHIPPGINLLHMRCAPWRSYAMAVTLADEKDYPQGLIYDSQDPYHYYRTQWVDGAPYLIAGGYDHKTAHEDNTHKWLAALEAHVRKYWNVVKVNNAWSSQYYEPADGLPYIGYLPGAQNNVLVATGFGGNGIIYSQVAARVLHGIITGKPVSYGHWFNPNRIKPIAGFSNFIVNNADVAAKLLSKLIPADELPTLSELAHGEGRVVEYEDTHLALYKDEAGEVHAVHPACTHMKCNVAWNVAERSWDCPCHGARYTPDGKVLNGPAVKDLTLVPITSITAK